MDITPFVELSIKAMSDDELKSGIAECDGVIDRDASVPSLLPRGKLVAAASSLRDALKQELDSRG